MVNKPFYQRCNYCDKMFNPCSVRHCDRIGGDICCYCCKKCEYNIFEEIGQACRLYERRDNGYSIN